jgi:hypothetical protein
MTPSQEEMLDIIVSDERASIQAAAYTIYSELVKTKPISQREFHQKFIDNWDFFRNTIEAEYKNEG